MSKFIFLVALISVSAACGFFAGQQTKTSTSFETPVLAAAKMPDFIKALQKIFEDEKIKDFKNWEDERGKKFVGVVRQLDEPCDKDSVLKTCQKLSIYDELGKAIYEKSDFGISFSIENLMRQNFQIVMTTNGGGNDDFLEIVDYQNGKFKEIIDPFETQMRGCWWTTNDYRTGRQAPNFKPSQIFVTKQIGGGDENPSAALFRFQDGKYQKVGEVQMQELGDFIEKQIAKNK